MDKKHEITNQICATYQTRGKLIDNGMSSTQPQAETVSLKCWLVFVYIYHFQFSPRSHPSFEGLFHWRSSSFQTFLIFGFVPELQFKIAGSSNQWLLRYSTLLFWGRLPLEVIWIFLFGYGNLCVNLNFRKIRSVVTEIFNFWRLSLFQEVLVWSPKNKFKIWGRSYRGLLRYSTFNIWRSSSIWGCLHFKKCWFGPLRINLKFEKDPINGCRGIQLIIFGGRLSFEFVFIFVWSPKASI